MSALRFSFEDGKYEVIRTADFRTQALRYGEPWRDLTGDKLINDMLNEIDRLQSIVAEVNAWAVCAAIATSEDVAQNFPRIVEITSP